MTSKALFIFDIQNSELFNLKFLKIWSRNFYKEMWLGNSFEVPFCLKKLKATIIGKLNFQKKLTVLKKYKEIYQNMSKSPLRGPGTSFQISFLQKMVIEISCIV